MELWSDAFKKKQTAAGMIDRCVTVAKKLTSRKKQIFLHIFLYLIFIPHHHKGKGKEKEEERKGRGRKKGKERLGDKDGTYVYRRMQDYCGRNQVWRINADTMLLLGIIKKVGF